MYCPECGKQNRDGAKFCENCGASLSGAAAPATPQKRSRGGVAGWVIGGIALALLLLVLTMGAYFLFLRQRGLINQQPQTQEIQIVQPVLGTETKTPALTPSLTITTSTEASTTGQPSTTASPTSKPPTAKPPTAVPPTAKPPTAVPPTAKPPTATPTATNPPATAGKTYVNVATGLCLDSNNAGDLYTMACNGGDFQQWALLGDLIFDVSTNLHMESTADGKVSMTAHFGYSSENWYQVGQTIINMDSGRCLDSNNAGQVYTLPCNGGDFQNWR